MDCGCKIEYLSTAWLENHYRLIVWKAAKMTLTFQNVQFWNIDYIFNQLLYRYDIEYNLAKRSFLRLAVEGDGAVNGHAVLCVAQISNSVSNKLEVLLTDGWYVISAELDGHLEHLIRSANIFAGQKLHLQGCKLSGSSEPCPILEAPPSLSLKLFANSTRRAKRFEQLGSRSSLFPVNLKSLLDLGGPVSCLDCTITRKFPTIYFEKIDDNRTISRSSQVEEEEIKEWQVKSLLTLEKVGA